MYDENRGTASSILFTNNTKRNYFVPIFYVSSHYLYFYCAMITSRMQRVEEFIHYILYIVRTDGNQISFSILFLSNATEPTRLRWKFFFLSSVVLVLSFIEHILSMFNNVEGYDWNASNSTFRNFLEIYTLRSHSFIFDIRECFTL